VVFADTAPHLDWLAFATVMVAAGLLAGFARFALDNPTLGPALQKHASRISYFCLVESERS
ncbi:MAG: hypothetical protein F6K44_29215, partial [Moorea sp. SIO3E2]|nr:hypothetical protein [Moorena sp. SIO3E2]